MADTEWDPDAYDGAHGFVAECGRDLVDLLDPEPGERILDLGCGTGHLTAALAAAGADVVGVDAAPEMVAEARESHPACTFAVADARAYEPEREFDAVFSNAALHWIPEADQGAVLDTVADALAPGGRFVAELGGRGNVATITEALGAELAARGHPRESDWFFPSLGAYTARIERHGFDVQFARLFDRPTPLECGDAGLRTWVEMFGEDLLARAEDGEREAILDGVEARVRDSLWDAEADQWVADYRRLRVRAVRER